jgi:thiol-disulfide isomerase/thioredoxin
VSPARPLVACLCAAWCVACREYKPTFDALTQRFAGVADFAWIDVEDESDAIGDPEIENFPTLLITAGEAALFFGPVTPQPQTAERLVQSAVAGDLTAPPDVGNDLAELVGKVRSLVRPD